MSDYIEVPGCLQTLKTRMHQGIGIRFLIYFLRVYLNIVFALNCIYVVKWGMSKQLSDYLSP